MDKVRTFPWIWGLYHLRLGKEDRITKDLALYARKSLSRFAATRLGNTTALVAMSASGLEAGREMKRLGGTWFCDRGSAHIQYQDQLLREEHAKWSVPYEHIDPRVIERELAEYEEADAVLVPSEFARRSFIQQGVHANKVIKIPYGVDLRDFYPGGGRPDGVFRILFVGGVTLQKGIPYLLQAVGRLHGDVELVIVGDDSLMPAGVLGQFDTAKVRWLGKQPRSEVRTWMQQSHVLVLPSVQDGFGLVMAEAMACGCTVVASHNTGIHDIVDDGVEGFSVPVGDAVALAERIQSLVDDPAMTRRMSEAAIARVSRLGGWNTYADGLISALTEVGGLHKTLVK
ncbi:MAG: glycosyltransferase family 4 protein [Fimbriimonadaceae bacterium]|nr:glycosyltransferase family 4 protein [Fimbriimonadaceae bacterium]